MKKEIKSLNKIPRDNFSKSIEIQSKINEQKFITPWVMPVKSNSKKLQKKITKEFQDSFHYFG